MLRYLLVFAIGALLGANVAWYYARSNAAPCPVTPVAVSTPTGTATPATTTPSAPVAPTPGLSAVAPIAPAATPVVTGSGLIIPVSGVARAQLVDTYTQSRAAGRVHEAIDIMAPAGTPVFAAIDGTVAKLFTSKLGGLTIYEFGPDGQRVYYYAHLQGYAPGLAEGQALKQGQVIGYVGSTGDASPEAPHLHFSVGDLGPEKQWWKSTPINPYPLLAQ